MDLNNKDSFNPFSGLEKKLLEKATTNLVFSSRDAEFALWGAGLFWEVLEVAIQTQYPAHQLCLS